METTKSCEKRIIRRPQRWLAEPLRPWCISATIQACLWEDIMNGIIYLIGLVVVVLAVLSLLGLR